ncbi:nickel-responsive transcriptional regulator NikR [Ferrimonas lipolytica]|uniref:Nickel-responsive transcriptional regulator NikR n=1 Tax=Ferrimonas lipolytica TaxID=2724191 RepID=A0A6H1UDJ0_9GAMM|nr:nickel-responsive transcriptional regulator NikR [Ferrimonas lipolytica]QIZ76660.1 nickel-responsive transcriptional regulator NikR [Ferrimonas lipolytica]
MSTERITMSLDSDLLVELDRLAAEDGYKNRSELFRDMIRHQIRERMLAAEPATDCVATLSYVFDTRKRTLATRLMDNLNQYHHLVRANTLVCVDEHFRMESIALRGRADQLQHFANIQLSESGVLNGCLHLVPFVANETC